MLKGVIWNLILAVIPAVLGYAFAMLLNLQQKRRAFLLLAIPVGLAWFFFLPNTCYLLTEWRHLLFDPSWEDLLDRGHRDPDAMLRVAKWALLFMAYSGAGAILFVFSIRPVERWLRSKKVPFPLLAPFFFCLMSLGVYLGLVKRYNSWDLLRGPLRIWHSAVEAVQIQPLLIAMLGFAVVLWVMYEAMDLWVDGVVGRLRDWKVLPAGAAPAKGKGGKGGKK